MFQKALTRLEILTKYLGWQGGTIHQVNGEFRRVFRDMQLPDRLKSIDFLTCDSDTMEQAIYIYSKNH